MVDEVIAHRQDLLGGRLLPILNGLRLANKFGARFLMTWVQGNDQFMSLVSGISEILNGRFLREAGDREGYRISPDDSRLKNSERDVEILPCPADADAGIGDLFVRPDLEARSLCLDRRFSLYKADAADTFDSVKTELSQIFRTLPKNPIIGDALGHLGQKMSCGRFAGLHARRMHILSDTEMTINRFDSYHTTDTFEIVGRHLLSTSDALLVASDSGEFVKTMQEKFGRSAISITDVLDVKRYTGLQRALLDMVFLGYAKNIYGALSAYGVVASVIGDGHFHNIRLFAAEHDLVGGDRTQSISLRRAETQKSVVSFATSRRLTAGYSALGNRLALGLLREGDAARAAALAGQALAMRFCEYGHATRYADWGHYVHVCRATAAAYTAAGNMSARSDVLTALNILERQIAGSEERLEAASGDILMDHLVLASSVVHADNADSALAPSLYEAAIREAESLGINPRGLFIRLASALHNSGMRQEAALASESATIADKNYADTWFNHARNLAACDRQDEALQAARKAVELEPEKAAYWFALAERLRAIGSVSEAEECRLRAKLIEPENGRYQISVLSGASDGPSVWPAST